MFYLSIDLGQAADYTALSILERIQPTKKVLDKASREWKDKPEGKHFYHGRHLERYELGTSYPAIVASVKERMMHPMLRGKTKLIIDATGVGRPVYDLFKAERLAPIAIGIHGGQEVTRNDMGGFNVPKRDLVSVTAVLLQTKRLQFAANMPLVQVLIDELLNFKVKISASGHDSYEAWREGQHDDLVLSVAMAAWYAEQHREPIMPQWFNYLSY